MAFVIDLMPFYNGGVCPADIPVCPSLSNGCHRGNVFRQMVICLRRAEPAQTGGVIQQGLDTTLI